MRRLRNIFLLIMTLAAASSCQWRPLEDPLNSIQLKVVIELKAVLNVNTSVYNEKIPVPTISSDMFRVLFYDPETGKLVSQAFLSEPTTNEEGQSCLGGDVKINPGTYDMVCYNFDVPDTYIENTDNIEELYAHTNGVSEAIRSKYASKATSSTDGIEDIRYEPDHLLVAREMGLVIAPHTGLLIIETTASTVVDTYYLQVHVTGAQYASSMSAVLSGMAPSNHFGIAQRDEDTPSSVYFELQTSTDEKIAGDNKDVLCGLFNTFGKIYYDENGNPTTVTPSTNTKASTSSDSQLYITFSVTRTDGKVFEYEFKMNDVFNSEDAIERHWLLINDTIDIPAPEVDPTPSSGGGFQPQVEDWSNEHADITL